jgi:hypothetical protein
LKVSEPLPVGAFVAYEDAAGGFRAARKFQNRLGIKVDSSGIVCG